jgi:hypothetical protein
MTLVSINVPNFTRTTTQPAPGVDPEETISENRRGTCRMIRVTLVCDATVVTRTLRIELRDVGAFSIIQLAPAGDMLAGETHAFTFMPGFPMPPAVNTFGPIVHHYTGLGGEWPLEPGYSIFAGFNNMQATDQAIMTTLNAFDVA